MQRIPKAEYARRRKALMAQMEPNSIAILPAAPVYIRNRDVEHIYRQDSDFQYLTGFPEPEAVLALIPGREHGEYVLFCRERDPERELWDGLRAGQDGAIAQFGADDAFPINDIDDILPGLIEGRERVYYAIGCNQEFDHRLMEWINVIRSKARQGAQPPNEFVALDHLLHDMRLYKSAAEVKVMKEAAEISAAAHVRAMQTARPGLSEYHLEAELEYIFRKNGSKMPAYGSIVASGRNACILHYRENDAPLKDGDLILIDAGCEWQGYASDITRTFPVNGRFSGPQRALYDLVLAAQQAAIEATRPGAGRLDAHWAAVRVLTQGLLDLKLLRPDAVGSVDDAIESAAYRRFYMHGTGHWLGLDVHDVGDVLQRDEPPVEQPDGMGGRVVKHPSRRLVPGMVLTIEPGIYVRPSESVPKEFWNIGIRIEDDALVTADGCELLTRGVPVAAEEIAMSASSAALGSGLTAQSP